MSACLADSPAVKGQLVFRRFPWFGPHRFDYETGVFRAEFQFRSFAELHAPLSVQRVLLLTDVDPVPVLRRVLTMGAPSNRDWSGELQVKPAGNGFILSSRYVPPATSAGKVAAADVELSLADDMGIGLRLFSASGDRGAALPTFSIVAAQIALEAGVLPGSLTVLPTGQRLPLPARETVSTDLRGTGYELAGANGAQLRVAFDAAASAARLCQGMPDRLPVLQVRLDEKEARIAFLFHGVVLPPESEALTARWRLRITRRRELKEGQ